MAKEEREQIVIPDEHGDEHLFEVLFTFDVEESGKSYMVLEPVGATEDDEEVEVFAFRFEDGEDEDDLALFPIETDEEWEMVEEMLNTFSEQDEDEE